MMKKHEKAWLKRVLILIDHYGWAFDFVSRGIIKHSTAYEYTVKRWSEVSGEDKNYDAVFAFNYDTLALTGGNRRWLGKARMLMKKFEEELSRFSDELVEQFRQAGV